MPYPRYGGQQGGGYGGGPGSHGGGAGSHNSGPRSHGGGPGSYGGGPGSHGGGPRSYGGGPGSHGGGPGPWQQSAVDPMALVGNLVGAIMNASNGGAGALAMALQGQQGGMMPGQQGGMMQGGMVQGQQGGMMPGRTSGGGDRRRGEERKDRIAGRLQLQQRSGPDERPWRSRSRERRSGGGGHRGSRGSPPPRRRSPPRAEHEIYIGNYPVKFREADVRKLFKEHGVEVGAIRMKHDGLKVFAFAETESSEQIEKAKSCMEGKDIQGRKLRVRSSKDSDKKQDQERRDRARRSARPAPLRREDTKPHLVTAFHAFLGRELEGEVATEVRGLLESARAALHAAYNLGEDGGLEVPRNIEDIFFRDVRLDIKPETVKQSAAEDDNGNRKSEVTEGGSGEQEKRIKVEKIDEMVVTKDDTEGGTEEANEEENDLDNTLATAEEGITLDD